MIVMIDVSLDTLSFYTRFLINEHLLSTGPLHSIPVLGTESYMQNTIPFPCGRVSQDVIATIHAGGMLADDASVLVLSRNV